MFTIDEIKRVISLLPLKQGKFTDNSFHCLCPFHNESRPSFSIHLENQFYKCFSCGEKGSIKKLVKKLTSNNIYNLLGITPNDSLNFYYKKSIYIKSDIIYKKSKKITDIKGKFYSIKDNKELLDYMSKYRRINIDFINEFSISYTKYCEINKDTTEKGTFFFNRIMIPIYYNKELVNFEGRDYTHKQNPKVLYPRNSLKPIFNYDNLDKEKPLLLVEGLMDFAILYQYIDKNCSCVLGNQLNDLQINLLNNFKTIYLIPDNDKGGNILIEELDKHYEGDLYICRLPDKYKDCGEADIHSIKDCIENRELYISYLINKYKLFN